MIIDGVFFKDWLWKAYWHGYKNARGVEEVKPITKRTAKEKFNRWYDQAREEERDEDR